MDSKGWIVFFVIKQCLCYDLTYFVKEDQSPGVYVGDIASDMRLMESIPASDRRLIKFSQLLQGVVGSPLLFRVARNTGKLYTSQTLDAESLCRHNKDCAQFVKVAVRREESFIKILKVRVIVKDVNDHAPKFPVETVSVAFSESEKEGSRANIPTASDGDIGVENSKITYELAANDYTQFILSRSYSADGDLALGIELKERLDREVKSMFLIKVIAKDNGSPSKQGILYVNVTVTDSNDNTPVFSQRLYNVSVIYGQNEDTPVVVLSARDLDSDKNGQISYRFTSGTSEAAKSYFELDKLSGEIHFRKKFLVKEDITYELFVKATDEGSPPLSSVAIVWVNMIKQENTAPTIQIKFFSASSQSSTTVSEDIKLGGFIAYVIAIDQNVGSNGEVSCELKHDKFQLESLEAKEYKITVCDRLDRETEDRYNLTIYCQDKGTPPLQNHTNVSIQVTDVNDVRPRFSNETYTFYIDENDKPGTWVGSITAADPDLGAGGKLIYSLLTGSKRFLPFQITDEGNITSVMSLDSEFQDIYKFWAVAKDGGVPSLNSTVHVSVKVQDLNDNAPYFTHPSVNPFVLDILYYPNQTRNITALKAADSDGPENAFLTYELKRGNDRQLFLINELTGLLSFSREPTQSDSGIYNLHFMVQDSGTPVLSTTTSVTLRLVVSNKTYENFDAIHFNPNAKIHMYLLIFIILVAVFASVIITAPISVCVIRCNGRKRPEGKKTSNSSNKRFRDLGVCPPYWPGELDKINDEELANGNTLNKTMKAGCIKNESDKEICDRYTEMKSHMDKNIVYKQVEESSDKEMEELTFKLPNNGLSTNNDSTDCWSDADTRPEEEIAPSDHFLRNGMKSRAGSPLVNSNKHLINSQNKATLMRTHSPSLAETDSITRRSYKARISRQNNCKDCDSIRTNKTESSLSGSQSHIGTCSPSSSYHKLHTVPETIPHLDCTRKIALNTGQMVSSNISLQAPVAKFVIKVVDSQYLPQETCT